MIKARFKFKQIVNKVINSQKITIFQMKKRISNIISKKNTKFRRCRSVNFDNRIKFLKLK